mgnify:CR=1 FL=1
MVDDWTRLGESRSELMIDLLEEEETSIEEDIRSGRLQEKAPAEARIPTMGQDWQRWDFGGDWWPDELGYYRSALPSLCRKNTEEDR